MGVALPCTFRKYTRFMLTVTLKITIPGPTLPLRFGLSVQNRTSGDATVWPTCLPDHCAFRQPSPNRMHVFHEHSYSWRTALSPHRNPYGVHAMFAFTSMAHGIMASRPGMDRACTPALVERGSAALTAMVASGVVAIAGHDSVDGDRVVRCERHVWGQWHELRNVICLPRNELLGVDHDPARDEGKVTVGGPGDGGRTGGTRWSDPSGMWLTAGRGLPGLTVP